MGEYNGNIFKPLLLANSEKYYKENIKVKLRKKPVVFTVQAQKRKEKENEIQAEVSICPKQNKKNPTPPQNLLFNSTRCHPTP